MMRRAMGVADIARHVIGCCFTQEARVQMRVESMTPRAIYAVLVRGANGDLEFLELIDLRPYKLQ